MITSAQDILFLVLAVCAVALTVFLAWFLYELIRIIRGIAKTIANIEEKLRRVDDLISLVREKLHAATTSITALTNVVASVVNFIRTKKSRKKNTRTDDEF